MAEKAHGSFGVKLPDPIHITAWMASPTLRREVEISIVLYNGCVTLQIGMRDCFAAEIVKLVVPTDTVLQRALPPLPLFCLFRSNVNRWQKKNV